MSWKIRNSNRPTINIEYNAVWLGLYWKDQCLLSVTFQLWIHLIKDTMKTIIKSIIFLPFFSIELIYGLNKDCGSYNLTNLDLETYHFYFRPTHLEQTLYCVGYKRYQPPSSGRLVRLLYKLIRVDETDST